MENRSEKLQTAVCDVGWAKQQIVAAVENNEDVVAAANALQLTDINFINDGIVCVSPDHALIRPEGYFAVEKASIAAVTKQHWGPIQHVFS